MTDYNSKNWNDGDDNIQKENFVNENSKRTQELLFTAQCGVLGSVLIDPNCAGNVVHSVSENDFNSEYKTIYKAIRSLFLSNKTIDPVTVMAVVGKPYQQTLLGLMEGTPTAANVDLYIDLLRKQSKLSRIKQLAYSVSMSVDLEEAQDLTQKLTEVFADKMKTQVVSMEEGLSQFYELQEKKTFQVDFHLRPLDKVLKAEKGDMIVFGGYPSSGKTAFTLATAFEQSKNKRVGYFSLETKPEKLFDRLVATVCGISFTDIKNKNLGENNWTLVSENSEKIVEHKLEIIKASQMTVSDIRAFVISRKYEVIYVDYLQLIESEGRRYSEFERVTQISRDLHNLANSTGVLVIALSQLTRPEKSGKKELAPGLHSLRQSGQIEQDADAVLLLYKENPDSLYSRRCLKVAKNKEGLSGGIIYLDFDGDKQRFVQSKQADYVNLHKELREINKNNKSQPAQMRFEEIDDGSEVPF